MDCTATHTHVSPFFGFTSFTSLYFHSHSLSSQGLITGDFCYQATHKSLKTGQEMKQSRVQRLHKRFGEMPIMVGSKGCHLHGLGSKELIQRKEEDNEIGGYFIVNGNERVIRMLQVTKRNHPIALVRPSYQKRGPTYSDKGVTIRCANASGDQSTITNTLHYLTTGGITLRFTMKKQEFLIPVVILLRALGNVTDEELYNRIVQGDSSNTFVCARAQLLLEDARRFCIYSSSEALAFLGSKFRYMTGKGNMATVSDEEVGHIVLRRYLLIHLVDYEDTLECLILMLRKVYALASGKCNPDNADSLQNHELLVAGHLMSA
jgi:DNA-directed RNA polymerase I subunit RPA2